MAEWISLTSKAVLDEKARALRRKCRGHYFSNYVWFSAAIEKEIPYSPMWLFEEGDNMLLLQQYNEFFKLFYFIGDITSFRLQLPAIVGEKKVLCEFIEEEGKEKQKEIAESLIQLGFAQYRKFYMMECTNEGVSVIPQDICDNDRESGVKYDKCLVIGTGTVANDCANLIKKTGIEVELIESRESDYSVSKQFCEQRAIPYKLLIGKELDTFLMEITEKILIVSASNRHLFPNEVVNKPNFTIVNYHGALLPKYPGRNAEAWAIFEGDEEAGITWHFVSSDVDAGNIIIQKSTPITEKSTSLSILNTNSQLAVSALSEILPQLLKDNVTGKKQLERHPVMYSWMKPNDGFLDVNWDSCKISRFLRSMNYGPLKVLGDPHVIIDGEDYTIGRYRIKDTDNKDNQTIKCENGALIVEKEEKRIEIQVVADKMGGKMTFNNNFSPEDLKELFQIFDPYVDLIPLPELFDEYYKSKQFLVCYVDDDYAGVVVYTVKDSIIDEDFIYVKPQYRGIGKYLYTEFLKHAFVDLGCKKVVPWVHTDNPKSLSFHTAAGAKQTPYYKLSFLTNLK